MTVCDCLSLNNTSNLLSSDFLPSFTFLTSKPRLLVSQTQQNSSRLFVSVTPSCVRMFAALLLSVHALSLSLAADFGGHICGFTSLLRLQDFEAESGEREMISDLTPLFFPLPLPFYSCSNAPHKMQLVCELIPPPAEL